MLMKSGKPWVAVFAKILLLVEAQMSESTPSLTGSLAGKTIALGVSGSIAAYKAADLTSELRKAGADIHVVMTESATKFISALTLGTLSRNPVLTSFWDEEGWQPGHIELADKIDLFLVAPATAQQVGVMPMDWLPIYWGRFIWRPKHRLCSHLQ